LSAYEAKLAIAAKLYEEGKITGGQTAEMVGMTRREFIETFGTKIEMTEEELKQEIENAQWASRHLDKKVTKRKKEYAVS
jgi:predicted HTH domain antitoxin